MFFSDPLNDDLYKDDIVNTQFLLTDSLLVAPILDEGNTSRLAYFPTSAWYDLFTGKRYEANQYFNVISELTGYIPIFLQ